MKKAFIIGFLVVLLGQLNGQIVASPEKSRKEQAKILKAIKAHTDKKAQSFHAPLCFYDANMACQIPAFPQTKEVNRLLNLSLKNSINERLLEAYKGRTFFKSASLRHKALSKTERSLWREFLEENNSLQVKAYEVLASGKQLFID